MGLSFGSVGGKLEICDMEKADLFFVPHQGDFYKELPSQDQDYNPDVAVPQQGRRELYTIQNFIIDPLNTKLNR